jgi:hypothetical protein
VPILVRTLASLAVKVGSTSPGEAKALPTANTLRRPYIIVSLENVYF